MTCASVSLVIVLVSSFWPALAAAETAYDAFPKAVTGSARAVALGGAVVADPDGYEAVFVNPAGLSGLAGHGIDFGSDGNSVDNFVVDLDNPKSRSLNVPLKYSYAGVRFVGDGWGLGFALQTPFSFNDGFRGTVRQQRKGSVLIINGDAHEITNEANGYSLAAGKSFLDGTLGVGAMLNYMRAREAYSLTPIISPSTAAFSRDVVHDAFSGGAGLLWQPRRWIRGGLVYQSGCRVPFGVENNKGVPNGVAPFRDLKTPDRLTLGLRLSPRDDMRLFLQGRYVFAMKNTVVVGAGVFPASPGSTVTSGFRDTIEGAWGVEYIACDYDDLVAKLWGGGYLEDANIQGGYTRYHRTAGFSLVPWFISFNMAIDNSELYDNFVVGLGVDLLKAAERVSKRYGWKLPI